MVSAGRLALAQGNDFVSAALFARQEDDGQPIMLSAMWLIPGVLVGLVVVILAVVSGKK